MKAFPVRDDENPMITALRMHLDDEEQHARRLVKLQAMWPDICGSDSDLKSWEETPVEVRDMVARRFGPALDES